ncbi:P-loop containing nucleoside triphosphate hydrolase protein [Globomyces pollinis-pini]|nr:P-loop containing nucleoside triphosphate hydrolase protein [Globomyces pollinis-pini]
MHITMSNQPVKPELGYSNKLLVVLRIRPLSQKELTPTKKNDKDVCITTIAKPIDQQTVMLYDPTEDYLDDILRKERKREKLYSFDQVFGENCSQQTVFEGSVQSQVDAVINGYNATVFAYGATGAGKTYTMMGVEKHPGIMYLTLNDLFLKISKKTGTFKISISYLEIYNEKIRDLLTGKSDNLELQEDPTRGVVVSGITYMTAKTPEKILSLLRKGNRNRIQESTGANQTSSRSHAILQVFVLYKSKSDIKPRFAKLSLIDLAGSERAAETLNRGMRMIEGANINRSLLALGNCINSLVEPGKKSEYINYRDSKLTRLLKDSLGGNCRTIMIANISPSSSNFDETVNTLKYASRARNIKTKLNSKENSEDYQNTLNQFRSDILLQKTQDSSSTLNIHDMTSFTINENPNAMNELTQAQQIKLAQLKSQLELYNKVELILNHTEELNLQFSNLKIFVNQFDDIYEKRDSILKREIDFDLELQQIPIELDSAESPSSDGDTFDLKIKNLKLNIQFIKHRIQLKKMNEWNSIYKLICVFQSRLIQYYHNNQSMSENQLQLIATSIIKYMKLFETLEFKCIPNYQDIQVLETLWLDKWNSNLVTQLDRQFKKPELKKKTSLKSIDLSFGFKKKLNHLKSNLNLMKDTSTSNLLPLDNLSETDRALNTHNEIEPSIPMSCDVKQSIPIKNIPLPAIELPSYTNPIEEEIDSSVYAYYE